MIEIAVAFFMDECLPLLAGVSQGRGVEAHALRQLAHEAHVLELERRPTAGGEVTPHHAVAVEMEDAAFGKAAEQGLPNERRVHAGKFREAQRLRHGVDGLRHDELVR